MLHVSEIALLNATARFGANGTPKGFAQAHQWELQRRRVCARKLQVLKFRQALEAKIRANVWQVLRSIFRIRTTAERSAVRDG